MRRSLCCPGAEAVGSSAEAALPVACASRTFSRQPLSTTTSPRQIRAAVTEGTQTPRYQACVTLVICAGQWCQTRYRGQTTSDQPKFACRPLRHAEHALEGGQALDAGDSSKRCGIVPNGTCLWRSPPTLLHIPGTGRSLAVPIREDSRPPEHLALKVDTLPLPAARRSSQPVRKCRYKI